MTRRTPSANESHDEIWLLLPWYINGTLDELESKRVRQHLQRCPRCQREITAQVSLCERVHHATPGDVAIDPAFQKLMARIQKETATAARNASEPKAPGIFGWWQRWSEPLFRQPVAWGLATALLAVAGLPLLPYRQPAAPVNTFHTSASPSSLAQFQLSDVRVVFSEPLAIAAIQGIVAPLNGRIVDGPSGPGVYTIRFRDSVRSPDLLASRLEALRARKDVALAEPAIPISERLP
jgi:anti-sigma factor RsiW